LDVEYINPNLAFNVSSNKFDNVFSSSLTSLLLNISAYDVISIFLLYGTYNGKSNGNGLL